MNQNQHNIICGDTSHSWQHCNNGAVLRIVEQEDQIEIETRCIRDGIELVKACPICGVEVLYHCWHPHTEEIDSEWVTVKQAECLVKAEDDLRLQRTLVSLKCLDREVLYDLMNENFCTTCFDSNTDCCCNPSYDI